MGGLPGHRVVQPVAGAFSDALCQRHAQDATHFSLATAVARKYAHVHYTGFPTLVSRRWRAHSPDHVLRNQPIESRPALAEGRTMEGVGRGYGMSQRGAVKMNPVPVGVTRHAQRPSSGTQDTQNQRLPDSCSPLRTCGDRLRVGNNKWVAGPVVARTSRHSGMPLAGIQRPLWGGADTESHGPVLRRVLGLKPAMSVTRSSAARLQPLPAPRAGQDGGQSGRATGVVPTRLIQADMAVTGKWGARRGDGAVWPPLDGWRDGQGSDGENPLGQSVKTQMARPSGQSAARLWIDAAFPLRTLHVPKTEPAPHPGPHPAHTPPASTKLEEASVTITRDQTQHPGERSHGGRPARPPSPRTIADQVFRILERRLSIEKERRGIL